MPATILLIEDDANIFELLKVHLESRGYLVHWEQDGRQGLAHALQTTPAICILDVQLPGISGIEICSQLRAQGKTYPVLMLTSRREESDKVLGLQVGADDYVCKPFGMLELVARVEAILRRAEKYSLPQGPQVETQGAIAFGDLQIDTNRHEVSRAGEVLSLTLLEFDLLLLFATNRGRVFTREQLLRDVWQYATVGYEATVNTHITRLRKKIELDPGNPQYIKTVWGVGYRAGEEAEFEKSQ